MELLDDENITLTTRQEIWFDNLIDEIYWCAPSWELNGYCRIELENDDEEIPFENLSTSDKAEDYVNIYLSLNGVIEIEKLISILEIAHQIKLSNKELRKIIKETDNLIITDKYIHTINLTKTDIDELMLVKNKINNYKIIDDVNKILEDLFDTTSNLCLTCCEYNLDEEILKTLQAFIITGELDKEIIKNIIKIEKIPISSNKEESLIKGLLEIQKNSRVWTLNGHKITELSIEK